jgi:hypothetical protein
MSIRNAKRSAFVAVVVAASAAAATVSAAPPLPGLSWSTVVNNTDVMPGSDRTFNSYNQPSVNQAGLVVIRARSKGGEEGGGGGQPTHGVYSRDIGAGGPIVKVIDRTSLVPDPNNRDATFIETPAFPRIDLASALYAFRGNSQPVWQYGEGEEETAGTTGVYANVGGALVTGACKLGGVPEFGFYAVPGLPGTSFEVFPGAPSATGSTIVFKGNYTDDGVARTGVFFRELTASPLGGSARVKVIGTSGDTLIPGTSTAFGSLSPPSGALGKVAFAAYDNEANPTLGGIYVAPLAERPAFTTVAGIGSPVPDWNGKGTSGRFNRLGEAVSFDGRYVAFWGAWGSERRTVVVTCPTEGNKARQEFCKAQNGGNPEYTFEVPVHQGIFVHDLQTGRTLMAAQTGSEYVDFVYWAFTGKVEGSIEGDDGEPATWRQSAYVAIGDGGGANFRVIFKASTPDAVTGLYMTAGPGAGIQSAVTVVDTTAPGRTVDPEAPEGSVVSEIGLERDGFRGDWLVINAKLLVPGGSEEEGMSGIYATRLPWPR